VIREREHGTLEHLLVMPLTAFEIAMAKVWANSLVILLATGASLFWIVQMALKVPFAGSIPCGSSAWCSTCSSRRRWDLPGHDLAVDGAVRAAHHPGHRGADAALGRLDAGREHAEWLQTLTYSCRRGTSSASRR
jgi:hypothetical protein